MSLESDEQTQSVGEICSTRRLERVHCLSQSVAVNILSHLLMIILVLALSSYFMNQKSKVFQRFKEFKALVTNDVGGTIGVLCSGNGGE